MAKIKPDPKIVQAARDDWHAQCKRAMSGGHFTDESAKKCLERHLKMNGVK